MSNVISGSTLADCFSIVSRCGKELEALKSALASMLEEKLGDASLNLPCVISGDTKESYVNDDSGWVALGYQKSIPLKTKGKGNRATERYLCFQFALSGEYIAYPRNREPLVHISLWDVPLDFKDNYMGWPIDQDQEYGLEYKKLICWKCADQVPWLEHMWTFSVMLSKLNSLADLGNNIVNPVLDLLKGKSIPESLHDDLPAIFLYDGLLEKADEVVVIS